VVGAAQGGYGAVTLATFHPDRYRYAGSLSGFLSPERTGYDGAITDGLARFGGVDIRNMWGLPQLGRWKWHSPNVHSQLLANNNTRLWIFSPATQECTDPAAMIGHCSLAQGSNRFFYQSYRTNGGHNAHFDFPPDGQHDWGTWAPQLAAMSGELVATIR
jgi:S-formylglutathione hydrolase FrmB